MSSRRWDPSAHPGDVAANEARHALGLGLDAPLSVLDAVEDVGAVPVCVADFGRDVAGMFYRRRGQSFLFVNGIQPVERQRFTLAHEFGHLRMGHSPRVESAASMGSRDPQEVEANYFAGSFLAPSQAVRNWAERHGAIQSDLELIVCMGAFFGISADASRIRLEKTEILTPRASEKLRARLAAREHSGMLATLGLSGFGDSLSSLADEVASQRRSLPRLPASFVRRAHEAHTRQLLDREDLDALLRARPVGEAPEPALSP